MRLLVAILLLVATIPGGAELLEVAAHAFTHGDLPHHDEDSSDGCSEHVCTSLRHQCGCHSQMSAQVVVDRFVTAPPTTKLLALCPITMFDGRSSEPPPLRPPIA